MNASFHIPWNRLDRRRFLRGTGWALALPLFESFSGVKTLGQGKAHPPRRLACFYFPDGVPMPRPDDPAHQDWAWFPHGHGRDYALT